MTPADASPDWTGLLRAVIGSNVQRVSGTAIKSSTAPATVYRLVVERDNAPPQTLIAKRAGPGWEDDADGGAREARFYGRLASQIGVRQPAVVYAGPEPGNDFHLTLLEDIDSAYHFPAADHRWTPEEAQLTLRTYARFHVAGREALDALTDRSWLFPSYERRLRHRSAELASLVEEVARRLKWRPLSGVERVVEETVAGLEALFSHNTLLHNDVAPQNVGLPRAGVPADEAMLVDWEMVGGGPAELDVAYPFLLPFENTIQVDRAVALETYWNERGRLEGTIPAGEERRERQRAADAVMVLWLVPVAARRAAAPFPSGSPPRVYWDAMFVVLERRLRALCAEAA